MGISYSSKKCPSCGSTKFEYIKDLKLWECSYCGNMIERNEQQDTLFTIKNVVRQVLVDVAYQRFNDAKSNLVECEKIDSRYVGTIIARICYYLNAAAFVNVSEEEKRNMYAQVKKYYGALRELSEKPTEEEYVLYEFIDSAEAYGVLILVYDIFDAQERINAIYDFFKPEEVYSLTLNSNLLKYMINHQKFDYVDRIVSNYNNIEKKSALISILDKYPDTEQKIANCDLLISQNLLSSDEKHIFENYLESSNDSIAAKFGIACSALKTNASPSVRCIMNSIVSKTDDCEMIKRIFEIIMSKKLVDEEIYTIIEFALGKCDSEVALYILKLFNDTNQFVVLNQQHFVLLLENRNIDNENKKEIIDLAIKFNVNDKTKDAFISYYLNEVNDDFVNREGFLTYLFSLVPSISTVAAEKYILLCSIDGENKPAVVKKIFDMDINKAFFRATLDKYIESSCDSQSVCERVIEVLLQIGLKISENTLVKLLIQNVFSEEKKLSLLRQIKNSNIKYLSLLDKYLISVPVQNFSGSVFQELMNENDSVSFEAATKYLLSINDTQTSKSVNSNKLISKCKIPVLTQNCKVNHNGSVVECTVLQAYVLISPDSADITCSVLESICAKDFKINTDIYFSGTHKKFKKYLSGMRGSLSPATAAAGKELGLI